ncbi:TonB-dependent receptor [Sphingomonas sp. HITSZ_GF]|uniref:TonB-dependent receptor plug domain-containing protein n=1 Tax=Sphingomonas sp. HITSZ_GF TaxID=3037247 RepID=UPI00240E2775|nr:TonB-dependent receptor [Sphingomonas sp. HITSZ_GF]MDG2533842.1 TonB-dependent receptor [Sphingomonas sp. HITSZ_GF]
MKKSFYGAASVVALICASSAHAQQVDEQTEPAAAPTEIVVTGSRVARTEFDNPTPTTVIGADRIEQTGLNDVGDVLLQMPQISVGLGASNDTFQRDIGASFINLRGLGTNRTLVLVNGRRRVSGSRDGSQVDVSSIPSSMVERIEIITGGASAVYGADAVSGVVNIILKDDYEGLNLAGRYGISARGDGATYMLSGSGGGKFADGRGSASLGLTYQKSDILRYTDRDYTYGDGALSFVSNPANTGPADGIADRIVINSPHTIGNSYQPTFVVGGRRYFYDNGLVPLNNPNCYSTVCSGGKYGYDSRERNLRNPREAFAAMGSVNYEITPAITAYANFEFSYSSSDTNGQSYFDSTLTLRRDNPTLPSAVTALMDANNLSTLTVGYEGEDIYGNKRYVNSRYTYTAVGGLRGKLTDRFNWEAFYQYGRRDQNYKVFNTRIESRFFEAIDAVLDTTTNQIVCRSATARAAGCTPISIFNGRLTDAQQAYYQYTFQRDVTNEQTLAGIQATGSLFDLPGGPLSVAVGAEYRKDRLQSVDDGMGARGLLYRTDNGGGPVDASSDVKEVFAELVVPVLKDVPFFRSLQVEGAARYSDYNTIGSTMAWKLGGEWAPIDALRFRVTRSRSVRAPNIVELYSPDTLGTLNITFDPCDATQINLAPNRLANCRALGVPVGWVDPAAALALPTALGGNPDLTEETSNSWTAGVVFNPVRNLRLSVDYWQIRIDNAIQTLDGNTIVDNCVDSASLDNAFCALVTRGGLAGVNDPYVVSNIDLRQINIGRLDARGIDVALNYSTKLDGISSKLGGRLSLGATVTYLDKLEELVDINDPASLLIEDGEFDDPTWRGTFNIAYSDGGLNLAWNTRYVGKSSLDVQRTSEYNGFLKVDQRFYHDVFASYKLPSDFTLQFGINNLFDTKPPRTPSTYTGAFDGSLYDNIGRSFYIGFSKNF